MSNADSTTTQPRPFAAFDIDGTIIRWQLYHAMADELAREGHLDPILYQAAREARMAWKKREHGASFDQYERTLVKVVEAAITGITPEEVQQACIKVLDEYKDQVYTYTRDLLATLKRDNYLLFAISGSQSEIVELVAKYYGFDDFGGTTYEIKEGTFTGKSNPLRREKKPIYLKKLVAKHQATWEGSIAVGDSESDIPMLSVVDSPIAFNPSRELFEEATKQNWEIVVERKNMVYKLGSDTHDTYTLTT